MPSAFMVATWAHPPNAKQLCYMNGYYYLFWYEKLFLTKYNIIDTSQKRNRKFTNSNVDKVSQPKSLVSTNHAFEVYTLTLTMPQSLENVCI